MGDGDMRDTAPKVLAAEADRASRNAAVTLALTLPSDAILYLLLPMYAVSFGLSLPEVGILLAANRLVRIFGNAWVARLYARFGPRAACLAAVVGSAVASLGFAFFSGLWPLLLMRIIWGLSYSGMNIANQALPTSVMEGAARRAGKARAIVAVGPMLGYVGGAVVAELYGPRLVCLILGLVCVLALTSSALLPSQSEQVSQDGPRFGWPGAISTWSFAMGFALDGLFMVGLSLLAAAALPKGAVLAAGCAFALRYVMEMLLSPASGAMAQSYGARRLLIHLSLGASVALCLLGGGGVLLWLGAVATVMLRAMLQPLPGPVVAEVFTGPDRVPALARQATWRDIGAGLGPLAAGVLFPLAPAALIYAGAAALLAASSLTLSRRER